MTLTWKKEGGEYRAVHGRFVVRKNDHGKWEAYDGESLIGVRDYRGTAQAVCVARFSIDVVKRNKARSVLLVHMLTNSIEGDGITDDDERETAREWLAEIEGRNDG